MRELDPAQCNRCASERLKAAHRGASAFDSAMVLLNQVIEVLAAPHLDELPPRVLPPQKPQRQVTLLVTIERYLAWPARQTCRKCLSEERLRSGDTAIRTKQKIHGLAVLVDSPIEKIPFPLNFDIGFIDTPGSIDGSGVAVPSLLELRHIAIHPTKNRRVRHDNPPLRHHRGEIPIAQAVSDIPADAQLNYLGIKAATSVNGISDYGLRHLGIPRGPELYDKAR